MPLRPYELPNSVFPREFGWHFEMQHVAERRTRVGKRLTMQDYYSYFNTMLWRHKSRLKHAYKGHDNTSFEVKDNPAADCEQNQTHDEITNSLACRYVSSPEAMWGLSEFKVHDTSHTDYRLAVYLEDQQRVYFHRGSAKQTAHAERDRETTLTAWFKLNVHDDVDAKNHLYPDIPLLYVFNEHTRTLTSRQMNTNIISRIYTVSPRDRKISLVNVAATCFRRVSLQDLRTVEREILRIVKASCLRYGLLSSDDKLEHALLEAAACRMPLQLRVMFAACRMPLQLRVMFAALCTYMNSENALHLWTTHKESMIEDFLQQGFNVEHAENMGLHSMQF
ncbi:uncharacterized protein LOC106881070 [Octopus bimaculoides]|uniref:uncharacterized protein LOC106881070 n=1 Tax=Octopus bimaculoides TaxID=37653 RepID=UPI00071D1346|nr:uncharacterized protein LOC106881070 [Octopus bimaculoides]|eukprot:XP_014786768.1 PREDICTED: uncharacterized protein LOC106881070 [Octopus bimaculoides]